MAIFSCKDQVADDMLGGQSNSSLVEEGIFDPTSVGIVYDSNGNAWHEYSEIDCMLTADGFTEVSQPIGWLPEYSGWENVYFYAKDSVIVDVYTWQDIDEIPTEVKSDFVRRWESSDPNKVYCIYPGRECKMKINGSDFIIICKN